MKRIVVLMAVMLCLVCVGQAAAGDYHDEGTLLCSQCHYAQGEDWAAGAHGKRLVGWRGPRVVMSCTGCHDPHDPTFGTQIPSPGPRIPRTGGAHR